MNSSKDEILHAIEVHQRKIARLRKLMNSLTVDGYQWEQESDDQKIRLLYLIAMSELEEN